MKTKYGFQLKKEYSVRELASNLLVTPSVLQNYLYKRGMVAKMGHEYSGEELVGILEDYKKEAHLRKDETRERSSYLLERLKNKEEVKEVIEVKVGDNIDVVEDIKNIIEDVKELEKEGIDVPFYKDRENILKIINLVSVISAMIGIGMKLGLMGVISLGLITALLLTYCLMLVQDKEVNKSKRDVAVFFMLIVEGFWGIFHNKTFEGFNASDAVFGESTSVWTAVLVGLLSYGSLLLQTFNDRD